MSVLNKALNFSLIVGFGLLTSCSTTHDSSSTFGSEATVDKNHQAVTLDVKPEPVIQNSKVEKVDTKTSSVVLDAETGFTVERSVDSSKYFIGQANSQPIFDIKKLSNPERLVLDLVGNPSLPTKDIDIKGDSYFKSVRIGAHKNKTRVVFDISSKRDFTHTIDAEQGKIVLTISDKKVEAKSADVAEQKAEVSLADVKFNKSKNDSGEVYLSFSGLAPNYEIKKTAPSEYVLDIKAKDIISTVQFPQIAPKGVSGIRVVRANKEKDSVVVRMFVDNGTELASRKIDNKIIVKVDDSLVRVSSDTRAQLELGAPPAPAPSEEEAKANPTGKIRSADGTKEYVGRLISLDLQDTDIDNALRIIAEVSNLNIIASDDVTGKVTLRLIDVPWDQALDVILKTNGLDQVSEGNVIRIAPIDKLRQERESLREAQKAAELLERLSVDYLRISYARASDLKEQVESVLSERGTVSVDERTNQLIIKDTKFGQDQVKELMKRLDLRTPQVLLETQIVESGRNILRDLGFQWNFSAKQSPATGNATGLNFPNSVTIQGSNGTGAAANASSFPAAISADAGFAVAAILDSADGSRSLSARLSALESERKVKVISRPQVATVNNKQAEISSVETFRVRTPDGGTAISTGAGAQASGGGSNAFEEIKVGIELRVTPQASPDYYVLLDVEAKSSTLGPSPAVDNIPSTLDRQATSTVLVKSGQTFALGGVYRLDDTDQLEGVPFLKDVPFLGHFFRRILVDKQDEELIFFITPHIVEGSFDPSLM